MTNISVFLVGKITGKAIVSLVASRVKEGAPGDHTELPEAIQEVAVLNCCYVLENDVLDLARMTVCRVCLRDDDYCRESSSSNSRHSTHMSAQQGRASVVKTPAIDNVSAFAI